MEYSRWHSIVQTNFLLGIILTKQSKVYDSLDEFVPGESPYHPTSLLRHIIPGVKENITINNFLHSSKQENTYCIYKIFFYPGMEDRLCADDKDTVITGLTYNFTPGFHPVIV